jgi:NAD(P)-dependent dehydrogenase (short-subunit alcohol dehydrogenase family)
MQLTLTQLETFIALSHDRNPLHADAAYAARTSFRQQVVHGVCGVLCALGQWAEGRRFELRTLRATFKRPLFLGQPYRLEITETEGKVTLRWMSGDECHADIRAGWRAWDGDETLVGPSSFMPRLEASDPQPVDLAGIPGTLEFALGERGLQAMREALGLSCAQLPRAQLAALCGASYLVGMVVPGRQALFADMTMKFARAGGPAFRDVRVSFDPRFNHVEVEGVGGALASFQLGAFRRPEGGTGLEPLARVVGRSARFAGKTAVVTGSSRGLGAVLTRAFALHGANVVVHFHESRERAAELVDELRELTEPLLIGADLTREAESRRFAATILDRFGHVDLLVHCAVPPILRVAYEDQSGDQVAAYVASSMAMAAGPSRALLPSMRAVPGAAAVSISSVYARDPPAGFAHYAAAKGALESFTVALAKELPEIAFLVVRPPRLIPDAGGTPGSGETSIAAWAAQSPANVAASVLDALGATKPGRCRVVDLG